MRRRVQHDVVRAQRLLQARLPLPPAGRTPSDPGPETPRAVRCGARGPPCEHRLLGRLRPHAARFSRGLPSCGGRVAPTLAKGAPHRPLLPSLGDGPTPPGRCGPRRGVAPPSLSLRAAAYLQEGQAHHVKPRGQFEQKAVPGSAHAWPRPVSPHAGALGRSSFGPRGPPSAAVP